MHSMTGFGAGESGSIDWRVTVELSGVNRKQLDLAINLPHSVSEIEPKVRKLIMGQVSRGRINARITVINESETSNVLVVDRNLARQYIQAAQELASQSNLEFDLTASDLLRSHGVFKIEETEVAVDQVETLITDATTQALVNLGKMQIEEGSHLRVDLEARLKIIESEIATIGTHSREVVEKHRENLHKRLSECGLQIDLNDERVMREVALYSEKCDITEEVTRIDSHVTQFRKYFASDEPVGRPMDFLCQELNRELNTIGSKANNAAIAQAVVRSKTELEKIREQVQNVQ